MTYSFQYARRRGFIATRLNPFKDRYVEENGEYKRDDTEEWQRWSEMIKHYQMVWDPVDVREYTNSVRSYGMLTYEIPAPRPRVTRRESRAREIFNLPGNRR